METSAIDVGAAQPGPWLSSTPQRAIGIWSMILALTVAKLVVAALTPLAFDEALYWRYSTHLAASYIDHPFLNPLLIRVGTTLFGQTPLGVRFMSVLLNLPATWAIWATARALHGAAVARTAAWFYNLTLVSAVGSIAATSDQVVVTTVCLLMAAVAQLWRSGRGQWWLVIGAVFGLGLCAKFTAAFFAVSVLLWVVLIPSERRWLLTPWPWLAGVVALVVFSPVLGWNAAHGWAQFVYQGGRLTVFHWTFRYLLELVGDLAILCGPPILVLGCVSFLGAAPDREDGRARAFVVAFAGPMLIFFVGYATHKRVQGNWPEPIVPALVIAAAFAAHHLSQFKARARAVARWSARLATPVGLLIALAVYIEAATGLLPLGAHDPRMRVLAVGWNDVAAEVLDGRQRLGAGAVLTTDYPLASWLRFYLPAQIPVEQIDDRMRWANEPTPDDRIFDGVLLYVCKAPCVKLDKVERRFRSVELSGTIKQDPLGVAGARYQLYRVSGRKGAVLDYRLYGADHRDL